jgi:hypothetical protein
MVTSGDLITYADINWEVFDFNMVTRKVNSESKVKPANGTVDNLLASTTDLMVGSENSIELHKDYYTTCVSSSKQIWN